MSEKEVATFNVKNISLRICGFAGAILAPNDVMKIVDDEKGINRKSIELDPFLDETDEEPNKESILDISVGAPPEVQVESVEKHVAPKPIGAASTKKPATGAKTATGAGWTKK